ncbi:MAG: hypothetical protein NPIRA01_03930 [Nitrospirales bacterium]|nr:MAG: hypothetical protein NPIRA01_03930 [Nitrospirales bacterium]
MRILFDQGIPVPLRKLLLPHQVETVFEHGWGLCTNSELLTKAQEEGVDVLLTTDQNHGICETFFEQNIAIVVLSSTSWPKIQATIASILQAIETSTPGKLHKVSIF